MIDNEINNLITEWNDKNALLLSESDPEDMQISALINKKQFLINQLLNVHYIGKKKRPTKK